MGRAIASTRRRKRLGAQHPAQGVERGGDMEIGVAIDPRDHRLVLIWHAIVLLLEEAGVPGRDGHNSDEASAAQVPMRSRRSSRTGRS